MDMDRLTRSARGSSIRVSSSTRKRVALLVAKLKASSQQDVIDQALAQLEHRVFWEGFEEEAKAYLASHPKERAERNRYAGTSSDGMKARP
jgi:predicted transcriptional regulator